MHFLDKKAFHLQIAIFSCSIFFSLLPSSAPMSLKDQSALVGSFLKVKPDNNKPFKDLRLTQSDRENVIYIISSMGEQNKIWLLMHKSEITSRGDKIEGIHPLKFLVVVCQDDYLRKVCMPTILNDYFKKKNFLEGFGANMTKEAQKGKVQKYMKAFMREANIDPSHFDSLMEFTKERDWEGFIWYIVNT